MCLAIPGKVISVAGEDSCLRQAEVSFGGVIRKVSLACTPDAVAGDYVLVHVGMALSKLDEQEAQRVFEYLAAIDELAELEEGAS